MMTTLIFVVVGFSLIAFLVFLLRRDEPETHQETLDSAVLDGRSEELLQRIFGDEDWNFVISSAPPETRRSFLKERRSIAFLWLSLVRGRARAAMRHHAVHSRVSRSLDPALEFRIILHYLGFQLMCALMAAGLWLRGPVALRSLVRRANQLSQALRGLTEIPGAPGTSAAASRT